MSDACSEPAGAIKAIDKHSVHQICSGQVVLTLATAVKELVENSIDAGATNIDVRLKEYGAELVEVSDNGKGVEEGNFEGLTLKHHTSKLKEFSDLIRVETFGFRGEALSSLCALSNLSVVTCHESSQVGTKLVFDHKGHLTQRSPHPRQQGSTVSLQQLFYTLPVRHKEFQRNIKKEYAKMIHVLQSYCIISTGVRITCSNQCGQGKRSLVLSTSGSQSVRDNIGAVFGPKQLQSLLPLQQMAPTENIVEEYGLIGADLPKQLFTITGFVSRGDHGVGRSATDRQFFFINNRPCDPLKVTKLVNEVYHTYNRHQYPFVALNVAVASECVDVNVTPDKRQIFVQEEKLLLATLKSSLINLYEAGVNKISMNYTRLPSSIFSLDASAAEVCLRESPHESLLQAEAEAAPEIQSPKSSLNLSGLKAAFSSSHSSNSGHTSKVAESGPMQKTLQSFFKGTAKTSSFAATLKSPQKRALSPAKSSLVRRSALDGFRYGTPCSDPDSDRGSAEPRCDVPVEAPGAQTWSTKTSSPERSTDSPSAKEEPAELADGSSPAASDDAESQAEPCALQEEPTRSPEAKRARTEPPCSPREGELSADSEEQSSRLDAPGCVQKRTVPLRFSVRELGARMTRLREQRARQGGDGPLYRRFKAKINPGENQSAEEELRKEIRKETFKDMEVVGQFNLGFIIVKFNADVFIVDQHATDEKYNFEMLQQHTVLRGQRLIAPQKLHLTAVNESILMENVDIFRKNGFEFVIDEDAQVMDRVKLVSLPTSKNWTFGPADIEELIFMLSDSPGVMCRPSRVRQMFASRACRKSVMIGTALSVSEMKKLLVHMGEIEHPWNCPHGRPTMRHLVNLDLISKD